MPMNVFDAHYKSFQKNVLPILVRRNIGVIAMKTLASGYVLRANVVSVERALRYIWSQPVSTIVSGMDTEKLLETNAGLAGQFKPMSKIEQLGVIAKTKAAAMTGDFEPFKTAPNFDGPVGRKLHGVS
jgi:predicted aldo/keto reductase-like oxidoreductase